MKQYLDAIKNRRESETFLYFKYGDDYYVSRNTAIVERKKKIYLEDLGIQDNPFGANHRLPSGHFKKIVIQKNLYLLGNGVIFSEDGQTKALNEYFKTSFDEFIIDAGIQASKKSEAWAYAFMKENKLRFTLIPAEQITPIYDEYEDLVRVIRRYDEEGKQVMLVVDANSIQRYEKKKGSKEFELISEYGHYTTLKQFEGVPVGEPEEHGFGIIPFIPLFNNPEKVSDLYVIKPLIDTYDVINSDFANNIDDMQDAFFTLKGYSGSTENLAEFMRQLKKYKVVPIGEDGEMETNQLEIPVTARDTFLKRIEKDIYKFAMAVDLSEIQGGSITNVYIKAMFSDLDLKTNEFENEIRKFIYGILAFINQVDGKSFTDEFTFDRSIIMNKTEAIDNIIKMVGLISDETALELLPYDIDIEQEKKRLQKQKDEVETMGLTTTNGIPLPEDQEGEEEPPEEGE